MPGPASERCLHHETRAAVCRCPECRRFFCRECVVPFEGRLLCAECIDSVSQGPVALEKKSSLLGQILLGAMALLFIWVVFYFFGWVILQYRETAPMTSSASGITGPSRT